MARNRLGPHDLEVEPEADWVAVMLLCEGTPLPPEDRYLADYLAAMRRLTLVDVPDYEVARRLHVSVRWVQRAMQRYFRDDAEVHRVRTARLKDPHTGRALRAALQGRAA